MERQQESHLPIEEAISGGESNGYDPTPLLDQLESHLILVPNRNAVIAYLAKHNPLCELLPEIGAQLRKALGKEVELSLEMYRDPEIDDRYLTLYVRQEKYDAQIMGRIDAVSQQCNGKLEEVSGYLLITTDFRRPRGTNGV